MKEPKITDKAIAAYVEELKAKLALYEKSPYLKTYLTLVGQLNDLNEQLAIKPQVNRTETRQKKEGDAIVDYEATITVTPGRLDLFGEKNDKEFDRAFKFMLEVNTLLDNIEKIRLKMTPEEKVDATKILKEFSVEARVLKKKEDAPTTEV